MISVRESGKITWPAGLWQTRPRGDNELQRESNPEVPLERHSEEFSLGPVSTRPFKDWHSSKIQKVKIKENDIDLIFSLVFLIEFYIIFIWMLFNFLYFIVTFLSKTFICSISILSAVTNAVLYTLTAFTNT